MTASDHGRLAQKLISGGILLLGIGAAVTTSRLPSASGYSGVGPNFMPAVVSGGLVVLGLWLLFEAFTGATLIYIIINIIVVSGMRWLERRVAVPGFISMGAPAAAH